MSRGRSTPDLGGARTAAGIPHIRVIDGYRFYSLIGVVFLHLLIASGVFQNASHAGQVAIWWLFGNVIDGFFMISGFGLFLGVMSTGGRIENLSNWAIRRGARLLPAYWLCLAVVLVLIALWPQPVRLIVFPELHEIGAHLVGLQWPLRVLDSGYPVGFNVAFPVWMLSVIISFYVVLPLIARSYYKHPFVGLAVAAAITLAWREFVLRNPAFFVRLEGSETPGDIVQLAATDQLPGWAFSFALGMTGAWLYYRSRKGDAAAAVTPRVGLGIAAVGFAGFSVFGYLYGSMAADNASFLGSLVTRVQEPVLGVAYSASRALLMAGIAMAPLWLQAPFTNRPVRAGAELSYAVYLIHWPIIIYVGSVLLGIPGDGSLRAAVALFATVLSLSFAYAYFSNRLVERPAIRWARRRTTPRPHRLSPSDPGPDEGRGVTSA